MVELISIHIPKTAGRSFLSILKAQYGEGSVAHFEKKNYSDKKRAAEQFKRSLTENSRVIHGHLHYKEIEDVHKKYNSRVIAWLRNPVDRVISNYSFFKKRISLSPEDAEMQRRSDVTLIEYANQEESRNRMSKFIQGIEPKDFYFIGITEHFERDIVELGELLNWSPLQIPRINDNREFKDGLPVVTEAEIKLIEELNKEDISLYESVVKLRNKNYC